ncbi:MAG: transposase [Bdellovibrionales bacterium]|nr:transposase [Bdellovibrionales bacterium]
MPRPITVLQSDFPYHVSARCINKEWFSVPMEEVWEIMSEQLHFIHHAFDLQIISFVLMSNHFHLIVRTPNCNIDLAMSWFMRETSRTLTRAGNRINQTYCGRYFRSIIESEHYLKNAYKYVYYNPVQAGICENVNDYPFSTLYGLLGRKSLYIPVEEDFILFQETEETLRWLNCTPMVDNWEAVRKGLRWNRFKLPKRNGRLHVLENDLL